LRRLDQPIALHGRHDTLAVRRPRVESTHPMPPFPRALPMVAAALSIAACAAASSRTWPGSQPVRITDPTRRIQFRGFSVLPPTGPGWFAMPPVPADPAPIYLVARFAKVVDQDRKSTRLNSSHLGISYA